MAKYGNISLPLPETYGQEKEAVLKAMKDGTVMEAEGRQMILKIQREANLWIVMTNGGYTLPTRRKRAALRKLAKVQKYLEEAKTMLAEKETRPDGEEIEAPVTPSPEPIDTPSRDPVKPVDPDEKSAFMEKLQSEIDEALTGKIGDMTPTQLNKLEQEVMDAFNKVTK